MSETSTRDEVMHEVARRIAEAVSPERIVLFGSCARGEMSEHSDIDLFIQVEPGRDLTEVSRKAYEAIRPLRDRLQRGVDIVVKDSQFVERYGDLVGTVVKAALEKGKVLYGD